MFKNCRKEDLRIVALELGETLSEKVTIVELTEIIKENKYFKEDVEFVKELIQYTIEDRKKVDEATNFPLAAPVVLSDCYMDDILSDSGSIEELIELQHQLIEMFQTAGMHLHKWCGNFPESVCEREKHIGTTTQHY
ncbi:hypothetical protein TNCT_588021 [Trichonephila clavata]|uniref:Uncharacterized protein n=1 Tax=Trichonephila clavata TaxID=2740835 RepID=A0A8X6J5M6_TRICU|nr:hypothetical protein TNCT_588021 [Trichonephila clavata]